MPQPDSDVGALLGYLRPAAPYVMPIAASALTFGLGLQATQGVGMVLRVSSATPLLGSALGALGIGAASAAAGQAFRHVRAEFGQEQRPGHAGRRPQPQPLWAGVRRQDLLIDALGGVLLWRGLGGRLASALPSDLFEAGALARRSLPARAARLAKQKYGPLYGNASELKKIGQFFESDGCHHCGRRSGDVIADHIPPNVKVYGAGYKDLLSSKPGSSGRTMKSVMKALGVQRPNQQVEELVALFDAQTRRRVAAVRRAHGSRTQRFGLLQRAVRRARALLRLPVGPPPQRLFPQCRPCSVKQAAAAKAGVRTLVWHNHGLLRPRSHHLAGVVMGLRYMHSSSGGGGSSTGSRKPKRQQNGSHSGPDWWWRESEAPTRPRPIGGSDWVGGRGSPW